MSLVPGTGEPPEARLTVLSGPSGVGKDAVLAAVRRRHPDVWVSTSVTTSRDEVSTWSIAAKAGTAMPKGLW